MVTKTEALALHRGDVLYHGRLLDSQKRPVRARVNGKCMTLKLDKNFFKLPMKHGLNEFFYIQPMINARDWHLTEEAAMMDGKQQIAA